MLSSFTNSRSSLPITIFFLLCFYELFFQKNFRRPLDNFQFSGELYFILFFKKLICVAFFVFFVALIVEYFLVRKFSFLSKGENIVR